MGRRSARWDVLALGFLVIKRSRPVTRDELG